MHAALADLCQWKHGGRTRRRGVRQCYVRVVEQMELLTTANVDGETGSGGQSSREYFRDADVVQSKAAVAVCY